MRIIHTDRKQVIDDEDTTRTATHPTWIEPLADQEQHEQWRDASIP